MNMRDKMRVLEQYEIVKQNEKYGIQYFDGTFTVEPIYDSIKKWKHLKNYYYSFNENNISDIPELYVIVKDGKIGFADNQKVIVEPIYDKIVEEVIDEEQGYLGPLYPIFAAIKNNKLGFIDKFGKPITDFIYDGADFPLTSPVARVLFEDGSQGHISLTTGKILYKDSTEKDVSYNTTKSHIVFFIENKRFKVFDNDGNLLAEFLKNGDLICDGARYINDKLLMYYSETEVGTALYKCGLMDYNGKILTEKKYFHIQAIAGSDKVLCANTLGKLYELVDVSGNVIMSKMRNVGSWEGETADGKLIPPINYWREDDDSFDPDNCLYIDESVLK